MNSELNTEPESIARRDKVVPILMLITILMIGGIMLGDLIGAMFR